MLTNHILETAIHHWPYVAPVITLPTNPKEYEQLSHRLDELLDKIGEDENHPLMSLVDIISQLISHYETQVQRTQMGTGINALQFLMQMHHLHQADLPEIGSQGVVSEILNGKRKLNLRQIRLLAKRFQVATTTFIDEY